MVQDHLTRWFRLVHDSPSSQLWYLQECIDTLYAHSHRLSGDNERLRTTQPTRHSRQDYSATKRYEKVTESCLGMV